MSELLNCVVWVFRPKEDTFLEQNYFKHWAAPHSKFGVRSIRGPHKIDWRAMCSIPLLSMFNFDLIKKLVESSANMSTVRIEWQIMKKLLLVEKLYFVSFENTEVCAYF